MGSNARELGNQSVSGGWVDGRGEGSRHVARRKLSGLTSHASANRQQYRAPRPRPARTWRGPLFGKEPEFSSEYLARMQRLVSEPRTHLYFDTSFLMLLAKLGSPARRQFVEWSTAIGPERFHVPLWAAHEFFKHRLINTVGKELKSDITKFDKAAKQLFGSLQVYASDQLFGFSDGGAMVLDEFRRTVQPLRAVLSLAASSKAAADGIQEVAEYIDQLLLPGSLDELIDDIETNERVRNRGSIPPAFQDAHKRGGDKGGGAEGGEERQRGDNSFGDLVFWREVLRHAKQARCAAVIVLTKDRKNDWYEKRHGNEGVEPDFFRRVSNPLPVPLPHPLLVREAHDFGAGTLDLLDPMYCGVLLEQSGAGYRRFASAVVDIDLADPPSSPKAARSWASRFGPSVRVLGADRDEGDAEEGDEEEPFDASLLDEQLLRSAGSPAEEAKAPLQAIASGDLAARIEAFAGLGQAELEDWVVDDLVTLGRFAAELAQEDVAPATDFLQNLRDLGPELPSEIRLPVYFGALGSLYLSKELAQIPPSGARASMILLDMSTSPEMQDATARLGQILRELGVPNAIGSAAPIELEVVIQPSANNKSPADLVAIKVDGTNLVTDTQTEPPLRFSSLLGMEPGGVDVTVGALIDIISRYHLLPRQRIRSSVDIDAKVRVAEFAGVERED